MNNLVSIRDILTNKVAHDGWLYLPRRPWNLDTQGIFVSSDKDADPNSDEHIPDIVKINKWEATLDSEGIEDIIFNAESQITNITIDDMFKAFIFYMDNDAYITF